MGDLFYREQEGPADSEVKQPGDGVDYSADGPSTWKKDPLSDRGMPPGNPGFVNLPERDSMNPSSGKVIPDSMGETLRNQLTYMNASAKRVASMYCNPLATSTAWIDPRGKVYEIPRGQTHDQWAERHLADDEVFEESGRTGWAWLVDRGWVRFVNFLNLEVRSQGASRAAMAAAADIVVDCALSRGDVDPEDRITFGVGVRTQRPTVADFVAEWGPPGAEERLFEGLMRRLSGSQIEAPARPAKTAALIGDIFSKTGPEVHRRAKGLQVIPKRFVPERGFWGFTVVGSSGTPYYVRIKGVRKSKSIVQLSKSDVRVSCSCPFWRWQGPEHWGKVNSFLYGKPRGTASFPIIRDPAEKHWACKHLLAALEKAKTYRFASEDERWYLDGPLAPLTDPDPARVAGLYRDARAESRVGPGPSPAESAALSLLEGSNMTIPELIDEVRGARMLFDPVSRKQVSGPDVIRALERLMPAPTSGSGVKVYHATTPQHARTLLLRGFIPSAKPVPLGGSYAPGQGIDPGLYVGSSARNVESYGRVILEVTVPRRALSVPTELAQLGETDPLAALRSHDGAVILSPIPPSAIRVVDGERYLRG